MWAKKCKKKKNNMTQFARKNNPRLNITKGKYI